MLRVIDSLQLTDEHRVATPGNWESGSDVVIVPSLQDEEEIKQRFPKGYKAVKSYLRRRQTHVPTGVATDTSAANNKGSQTGCPFYA